MTCKKKRSFACGVRVDTKIACPRRRSHTLDDGQEGVHEVSLTCYDSDGVTIDLAADTQPPLQFKNQPNMSHWDLRVPIMGDPDRAVTIPLVEAIENSGAHVTGSIQHVTLTVTATANGLPPETRIVILTVRV
ncbi:hypothetical protein GCM10022295_07640 [Streptomyces osmaniensis]|uniref:Uncharacterized protein n=1 Tax=Streptomyces osmaniensis TaxID=593134 RepID=A0ABP6V487_9ACTN